MSAYLLRRLLYAVPTLIGVNILVFLLFFLVNSPDDMARQALGDKASTPEQLQRWQEARGYDRPRFFNRDASGLAMLSDTIFYQKSIAMFWGNFGRSDMTHEPIGAEIRRRIAPSLCITVPIFAGSMLVNVLAAMLVASRRGSRSDLVVQLLCVLTMSISTLIYIIGGQFLFAKVLRLVPVSGFLPGYDMLKFLVLPVAVGIIGNLGGGIRLYRTLFLEEINRDYVRTARAKGLPENRVLFLHVLKNALIPILTNVPIQLLMLIMGNMLLENFFSIPGLGGYTIMAINTQDFAVLRAMVFLGSALYLIGLVLTDLSYATVDPRIRLE
jgi:peptide/nickel transport system permease protein